MIDMQDELDNLQKVVHRVRAYLGRDMYREARNEIVPCAVVCDAIARVSNHISTEQLIRLKDLSEQARDILLYIDEKIDG